MASTPVNQHGRKGGRGVRPWLLIPKVLAMAVLMGSLVSLAVLAFGEGGRDPSDAAAADAFAGTVERIYWRAVVPALLVTLACGIGLIAQHFFVFWSRRWMKLKVGFVSALVMAVVSIGYAIGQLDPTHAVRWRTAVDLVQAASLAAIVLGALVVWLGRHKPRLGQTPGPARSRRRPLTDPEDDT